MRLAVFFALLVPIAPALEQTPKEVYRHRRVKLAGQLEQQYALLFAASPGDPRYTFRQDSDFYYLTGLTQPNAVLLIVAPRPESRQNPAYKRAYAEILFLPDKASGLGGGVEMNARTPGVAGIMGVDRVESAGMLAQELVRFGVQLRAQIWTQTAHPNANAIRTLTELEKSMLRSGVERNVAPVLNKLRAVKDEFEVELIKKSTQVSIEAHFAAMKAMKPGLYEYEIGALMEYEYRRRGCERPAYAPIVASGVNAWFGHYNSNGARMKSGDLVFLDVAGECSMYAADVARTLPVNGKYTIRQRELYHLVREAELAVLQAFRPGESTLYGKSDSLDMVFLAYLASHQLDKFKHSGIGHLIGLDVHDAGDNMAAYTSPLVPGNVFNIEPNIFLPDERMGIGIEDTFWVDPDGKLVNLTAELPVEPEDIERVMAGTSPRS